MVTRSKWNEIARAIFRVRSFKGANPAQIRRRFALARNLIQDVVAGHLRLVTAKQLAREGFDAILASPLFGGGGTHGSHVVQGESYA